MPLGVIILAMAGFYATGYADYGSTFLVPIKLFFFAILVFILSSRSCYREELGLVRGFLLEIKGRVLKRKG